jgi:resuscitation-promoting factor RpfB
MFYNLMICESSGNPRALEEPGGNGGALGHYGLFQFDYPTWQSVGGHGDPRDASPEEQWMRAYALYRTRGWQPWECATDDNLLNYA